VRGSGRDRDVLVAAGGDRFVVAVGRRALRDALSPGDRLGDGAAFKDAAGRIGGGVRPSFYLDVQRLAALAEAKHGSGGGSGSGSGSGSGMDSAREYLRAFGVVTGGASRDGDTTRGRAIATLR
jgi:hypothetical protein